MDADRSLATAILDLLERIERLLAGGMPETGLLDRAAVARWLGVSTRWVARHLTPTSQPRRGGRAFYRREDVERQLEALRPSKAAAPTPKKRPLAKVRRDGVAPAVPAQVTELEARLRGSAANGRAKAPIRSRRARS
jgi:hypothetical protein